MKTTIKKELEISEQMYSSTSNFVWQNGLEKEAEELFGKDWENEDDCNQIEQLLEFINKPFFEVEFIEGLKSNEDIKVWFNVAQCELSKLKELLKKQKECISDVLNTLYSLEQVYEFDETSTGKQIGEVVNKLQETFLKS